jgi:hypothetical protein
MRWENFGLDIGTRYNFAALNSKGNFTFEPRINLTYRIVRPIAVKASIGLYEQSLTTLTDENDVVALFEPWFITPSYLEAARSIQYNLGMEVNITNEIKLSLETYYKDLSNIPVLNVEKKLVTENDLVGSSGEAYGFEALFETKMEPFRFTSSYALSSSFQRVGKDKFPPRFDSRHTLKSNIDINLGDGWLAGITWNFHTGHPFTPTAGYYDKLFINDLSLEEFYSSYYAFTLLGERNSQRLPAYHRLDFNMSKRFTINILKFTLNLSVLNIYNRKNLFYFERDTRKRVNMLPVLISGTIKMEI